MANHFTLSLLILSFGSTLACLDGEATSPSSESAANVTAADTTTTADTTEPADTTHGTESGDSTDATDSTQASGPDQPDGETGDGGLPPDPNEQIPPPDEEGCHAIYAQDLLPTFNLTIAPVVWQLLQYEWNNGVDIEDMGGNPKPYHPLATFEYGDVVIHNAEIRLRGNATYWDPIPGDKMQFQIGFHVNDEDGHFLGLKRLLFDAATYNRHFLRDRLSLAFMRDVGVDAPCANNARLVINGEYYGLFTNIEKLDEAFLERVFDDPTGDLWKRTNWQLKTNQETSSDAHLSNLLGAETPEELFTYLDIEQTLRVFAAEAIIPDSDGMWAGGLNFYVYDEPIGEKFVVLPWDLDNTFERFNDGPNGPYPENPDPFVWEKETTHGRPFYDIALEDPMWFKLYIDLIDEALHDGYTPAKMHDRIDTWTAQIQDAALEDTNKPYSNDTYMNKLEDLHEYVDVRYAFVDDWLECWQNGGVDDGDGYCEQP